MPLPRCLLQGTCSLPVHSTLWPNLTLVSAAWQTSDVALPIKLCLVKTMGFPVVMYGCESWTLKKAEHQRIDAFEL